MLSRLRIAFSCALIAFCCACRVTLISGYDANLDALAMQMQKDFNLHFIRLQRALMTADGNKDQAFAAYQDYYDHLNADTVVLSARAAYLGKKADKARQLTQGVISALRRFEAMHANMLSDPTQMFLDNPIDNRADLRNNVNTAFNSLIKLEEALKTTAKPD